MAHHCKYVVVHCIDFRFGKAIKEFLEKEGLLGDCDIVSVAGGVKNSNFIMEQLGISVKLHNSQEAVLINHLDCGAYGGSQAFASLEQERSFQAQELAKNRDMIQSEYPSMAVRMLLAVILPSGEVRFEKVNA